MGYLHTLQNVGITKAFDQRSHTFLMLSQFKKYTWVPHYHLQPRAPQRTCEIDTENN